MQVLNFCEDRYKKCVSQNIVYYKVMVHYLL